MRKLDMGDFFVCLNLNLHIKINMYTTLYFYV